MKNFILSILKYLTLPFAILYGIVVFIRNKFYDWEIFTSIAFDLPVICVGNITVGGTGKSPHIEYLIELLSSTYHVATLSRGYRRHSRGFRLADIHSNARDIGDEPYQFKSKYPLIDVCVAEERMTAIPQLLQLRPQLQVILLDDAFQHRTVKPGLNILLTDYERRYTKDFILPFGLLRESRTASARANIIIVSKCPPNISQDEKQKLIIEINPLPSQQVFFSSIEYKSIYSLTNNDIHFSKDTDVLLVTGIANPTPLFEKLSKEFNKVYTLSFKDHHYFTFDDLNEINDAFEHINNKNKIIITTEKDASRLMLLKERIAELKWPLFAQSIGIRFLFDDQQPFNTDVQQFVQKYHPIIDDTYETDIENNLI